MLSIISPMNAKHQNDNESMVSLTWVPLAEEGLQPHGGQQALGQCILQKMAWTKKLKILQLEHSLVTC